MPFEPLIKRLGGVLSPIGSADVQHGQFNPAMDAGNPPFRRVLTLQLTSDGSEFLIGGDGGWRVHVPVGYTFGFGFEGILILPDDSVNHYAGRGYIQNTGAGLWPIGNGIWCPQPAMGQMDVRFFAGDPRHQTFNADGPCDMAALWPMEAECSEQTHAAIAFAIGDYLAAPATVDTFGIIAAYIDQYGSSVRPFPVGSRGFIALDILGVYAPPQSASSGSS